MIGDPLVKIGNMRTDMRTGMTPAQVCNAARIDAAVGIAAFCLVLRIILIGTVVRCSFCLPVSY